MYNKVLLRLHVDLFNDVNHKPERVKKQPRALPMYATENTEIVNYISDLLS